MKTQTFLLASIIVMGASLPAAAETFDAAKDFSIAANPNGVWSYMYEGPSGGAPSLFPKKGTGPMEARAGVVSFWNTGAAGWDGYHAIFANTTKAPVTVSQGLVLQPGALVLHPSNKGAKSVLRFVAPGAGTYQINATFTAIDDQAKKTDVAVRVNGAAVLSKDLSGHGATGSYKGEATLASGQAVDFVVGNGGDGFADDAVQLNATVSRADQPAAAPKLEGWYRLKTVFQGPAKCLEGNEAKSPVKQGAAFMDDCKNVSGQLWQFVPEGAFFRMKTQFQGEKKCLEGNQAASPVKGGAAFMDNCQAVSGQLWKVVPEGDAFRLKTQFQGDAKCLEGNQAASPVKGGAAFMDNCQGVSGQLWKLER